MSTAVAEKSVSTPVAKSSDSKDLWAILAGLRGLFALIVLATHVDQFVPHVHWLKPLVHLNGFAAVLGFFVVSGYSIAHSIELSRKGFYTRRAQRIYPLYLLSYLLALLPFYLVGHVLPSVPGVHIYGPPSMKNDLCNLFFLNGFVSDRFLTNAPMWTLSIEISYYVLAPIFWRLPSMALLGIIGISGGLYYMHDHFHINLMMDVKHGMPAAMLLWAWLSGFLFYRHRTNWWAQVGLIAIGTYLLSRFCQGDLDYAIVTYAVSMFVIITAPNLALTERWRKWLSYSGEISYPLYILHYPTLIWLAALGVHRSTIPYLIAPVIVSVAAYHLVDVPLRVRRRKRPVISQASA